MQTLTLSGWTQPSDALVPLVEHALTFDYSDYRDADAAIDALAPFRDVPNVVGWSMGGQLALRALARGVIAPRHLLLIAPPFQFVSDAAMPHGMSPVTFTQFRTNYAQDTERTVERFHGLIAKGHRDPRQIMRQLRHHPHVKDTDRWLPWLDALATDSLHGLSLPGDTRITLLQGGRDAIVPPAQAHFIRGLCPTMRYELMESAGHAPHLEDPAHFASLLAA